MEPPHPVPLTHCQRAVVSCIKTPALFNLLSGCLALPHCSTDSFDLQTSSCQALKESSKQLLLMTPLCLMYLSHRRLILFALSPSFLFLSARLLCSSASTTSCGDISLATRIWRLLTHSPYYEHRVHRVPHSTRSLPTFSLLYTCLLCIHT